MTNMINEIVGFENIHVHTSIGSHLDGHGNPEEYAERLKGRSNYLCITDHGMMSAIPRQIKACKNNGLTPVFGIELYLNPQQIEYESADQFKEYVRNLSPVEQKALRKSYHLLAIAYNETGYSNLVKLSSLAWTKGYYYKPRVNHEQLNRYKEGIIFTSCCYLGEIGQAFDRGGEEAACEMIEKYMAMFGSNFYLEMMLLDFPKQKPFNQFLIKAHEKYKIPLEVACDCHFCNPGDSKYQQRMLMIRGKKTIADIQRLIDQGEQEFFELQDTNLWLKTEEELNEKWYNDYRHMIDYELFKQAKLNTVEICRKAGNVELDRSPKLPIFPDADARLREQVLRGFKRLGLPQEKRYLSRIKEELELISNKSFSSYFLILQQIVNEAKRFYMALTGSPNATGPGRGSCVSSLVCYCLGATKIDPIKHDLLFSRFLSEARDDFPDADLDFESTTREYLKKDWIPKTFGDEYVAQIGSYNTFGVKAALVDSARIHDEDRNEVLAITKEIGTKDDDGKELTWDGAMEVYPHLREYCENHKEVADTAKNLLHRVRSMGTHAGGIIISGQPINRFIPLVRGKGGEVVSSWTEGLHEQELGPMGFVKYDLLVITNIEQINYATALIKKRHGLDSLWSKDGKEDWTDDGYSEDKKALSFANRGDLKGIFQFDSEGIRNLVKRGGVDSFSDLAAYAAIFRPALLRMGVDDSYVKRKKGEEEYEIHPKLLPVLGRTYGLMLYQEQVAQVLHIVGRIPLRDCELLRKAISKKKEEFFGPYKKQFIENGQNVLGWSQEQVEELWEQIAAFSKYGFNKCLAGSMVVYTEEGASVKIKDIVEKGSPIKILSYDRELNLTCFKKVTAFYSNGKKPVFRMKLSSGDFIDSTSNHRHLSPYGWQTLDEFKTGDLVASIKDNKLKWAKVEEIIPRGEEETYDLTVEDNHNFVCNNIITHNSHTIAYTTISSILLYLKAHYPLEFFASILRFETEADKIKEYLIDVKKHSIPVMPLDINQSKEKIDIVGESLYFGFSNVKGIGAGAAQKIVSLQPYSSFYDFLNRHGSDSNVVKPLLGLRAFKDADPVTLYKFSEYYKDEKKKRESRDIRAKVSLEKMMGEVGDLIGTKLTDLKQVLEIDLEFYEQLFDAEKFRKLNMVINRFKRRLADHKNKVASDVSFDKVDVDLSNYEIDSKLEKIYQSVEESESQFYGFLWTHPLQKSPDYKGNLTFDSFREQKLIVGRVEIAINKVEKKLSKSGKVTYWVLEAEDANSEKKFIQVWEDDWVRFKDKLYKGNFVNMEIKAPQSGFARYTLNGPPKWERHKLPKDAVCDFRVVAMKPSPFS